MVAALAAISVIGTASAATIYSDSLTGSDTALEGTTADTSAAFAGGTASATWTAAGSINETAGGAAVLNNTMAFLPITITTGYVYTLQATITNVGAGWSALGFSDDATTSGAWHTIGDKTAWALLQSENGDTSAPQFFGGPATANPGAWSSTADGTQILTITLDATNALWSTYATIDGVNSNTVTYAANPTITHVGFGVQTATSTVSNFSLSAVVPEPSTALLGGIGLLALLRRRRA